MESGGYEELGIAAALSRPWDYPTACEELSAMLRLGYSHLPKRLQFIVFQDTLLALRILPNIQTGYGVEAANSLLQAAEAVLPKQKKAMVVSEYKHSIIAHKRRSTSHHYDGDTVELPYDMLVSVFSHLDMKSWVAASLVCRSWNVAANENTLWKIEYSIFFGKSGVKEIDTPYDFDWKLSFQDKYKCSKLYKLVQYLTTSQIWIEILFNYHTEIDTEKIHSRFPNIIGVYAYISFRYCLTTTQRLIPTNRTVCRNCNSVVWLSALTSRAPHSCSMLEQKEPNLKLISPKKFPKYVLGEALWGEFGFDADDQSDSNEPSWGQYRLPKWANSSFESDSSLFSL